MPRNPLPLTLILAATPSLGIGRAGGLPWKSLRGDMAFFARVTKRVPPNLAPAPHTDTKVQNAVVMGRKTWESIPKKFRPLAGRVNVVVSRRGVVEGVEEARRKEKVVVVRGLEEGVRSLEKGVVGEEGDVEVTLGRVFVIGGGSVYTEALKMEGARRVLLTRVGKEFECDTFFPVDLGSEEARTEGWVRRSKTELEEFAGEVVEEGNEEGEVPYEFCLYEKEVVE